MQRFLSGRSVRGLSKVNRRNFQEAKNTLKDFVNGTKQQPTNHLQLHSLMYRNGWKNFKAIRMKNYTCLRQSIGNWKRNMETAYDSRHVRVDHLLCCSMKRQIKSYLKVHWRRCLIVVTLRKIWETSFSLAERLHNVCMKAVNVKNIILIQRPYSRKPFRSHSKEIIIFPRCYIYEVKDIYSSRKEKFAKGHHCSRDHATVHKRRIPVTTFTCYRFACPSKHKITCSGWCSVHIGTFVIILGFIRFRKICKCIHDRIHRYVIWRRVDGMLPSVHRQ